MALVLLFVLAYSAYSFQLAPPPAPAYTDAPAYNILGIFPHWGRSHYAVMEAVMLKLAEKGHRVSVYSPFPQPRPVRNLLEFHTGNCSLSRRPFDFTVDALSDVQSSALRSLYVMINMDPISAQTIKECEPLYQLLRSDQTFDLLVTEAFSSDVLLLFANRFGIPFIGYSPTHLMPWHHRRLANPSNPSYVPVLNTGFYPPMDFWQRSFNALLYLFGDLVHDADALRRSDEANVALLGPGAPSLYDAVRQTSIFFTNVHPSLHTGQPSVPSIVDIAGAHIRPPKTLPQVCT